MPSRAKFVGWTAGICAAAVFSIAGAAHAELTVVKQWPADANACSDSPLRLTFNEPPVVGTHGKIEVSRASDGKQVDLIDLAAPEFVDRAGLRGGYLLHTVPVRVEGNTAEIWLHSHTLSFGENYVVKIEPGVFRDAAGHDFAGVSDWKFQTKPALPKNPDRLTVSDDGSGDFCTVQGAVDQFEPHRIKPAEIFIRKGVYRELIRIGRELTHICLKGEDRKETVIAFANNDKLNPGWIQRSVLGVEGDDFHLENLTVRNTTPYKGSQAEALYINAERCIVRDADFFSFQDTLNLSGRVCVENCYVEGDVDFIWGFGTVFFENCELHAVHDGYFLQSRNQPGVMGYIFARCKLTTAPEVKKCPLGRIETARFPASQIVFIDCKMGPGVPLAGWVVTGSDVAQLAFEEFQSMDMEGKPLDISQRHPASRQLSADEAKKMSEASRVLAGSDGWNPKAK